MHVTQEGAGRNQAAVGREILCEADVVWAPTKELAFLCSVNAFLYPASIKEIMHLDFSDSSVH